MLLSALFSAPSTFSTQVTHRRNINQKSWNEIFPSVSCLRIRRQQVGCRREQGFGTADWSSLKCQASGEAEENFAAVSSSQSPENASRKENARANLAVGSPVVVVEAPPLLKTAEPMPMMRPNRGLIKTGDAGRVIDRKPKDVWAVRFAAGAYLIEGKYFEPLLEE
ncbi:hypothetical protein R1flu_022764 [Riccia fluitans]|uniref:Chlororespiratory reduction 42 n=1 Tax=Riccia fluitans TaxID=41844 RepID=A0ABD1XQ43_9MARC